MGRTRKEISTSIEEAEEVESDSHEELESTVRLSPASAQLQPLTACCDCMQGLVAVPALCTALLVFVLVALCAAMGAVCYQFQLVRVESQSTSVMLLRNASQNTMRVVGMQTAMVAQQQQITYQQERLVLLQQRVAALTSPPPPPPNVAPAEGGPKKSKPRSCIMPICCSSTSVSAREMKHRCN